MARNRMIKPELWSSKRINRISLQSNLLFIALWNFCDDYGLLPNSNRLILGNCFPFRENVSEKDVEKWKKELVKVQLIFEFEYNGKSLISISNWEKHQIVPNRSRRNNLSNDLELHEILTTIESLRENKLESNESLISNKLESNALKIERERERERKKEKEIKAPFGKNKTVFLSDDEYQKLVEEFNLLGTEERIQKLEDYMLSKGKLREYKSHYHTILNWERMDKTRGGNGNACSADKKYIKTKTF